MHEHGIGRMERATWAEVSAPVQAPGAALTAMNTRRSEWFLNTSGSIIPSATTGFNARCRQTTDKKPCPASLHFSLSL